MSGRPETGSMQFGDDWPGVFIRGDNAAAHAMYLSMALESGKMDPMHAVMLQGLLADLQGCMVGGGEDPPGVQYIKPWDECQREVE